MPPQQLHHLATQIYRLISLEESAISVVFREDLVAEDFTVLDSLGSTKGSTRSALKWLVSGLLETFLRSPARKAIYPLRKRQTLHSIAGARN